MLSAAKHLDDEGNLRLLSCVAQILRFAQDDRGGGNTHKTQLHTVRPVGGLTLYRMAACGTMTPKDG
jgi:hypothetical protein